MAVDIVPAINRVMQEFDATMFQSYMDTPHIWQAFGMEMPSSSRSTLHAWLADQSVVREWLGPRVENEMGTRSWEIVNRSWELSYKFSVNQARDDLSGLTSSALMAARSNGQKWRNHEDLLMAQTLEAGTSALCFDGQYFFDTDHPIDLDGITSGTFSNSLSGSFSHANVNAALVAFGKFKNIDGSPMIPPGSNITCVVPPDLQLQAEQVFVVKNLTAAASYGLFGTSGMSENPLVGKAKISVNPYLTSTTRWYLTVDRAGMKPIIFQRRQGIESLELGPGSLNYYDRKEIKIGGDARYAASYSLPQLAITSA